MRTLGPCPVKPLGRVSSKGLVYTEMLGPLEHFQKS